MARKKVDVDVKITKDWERPRPLSIENKNPEMAYRWVDKKKLEQRRYEGCEPVRDEKVIHHNPDGDRGTLTKEYRELILCHMPKQKAMERNRYYMEKARKAMEAAKVRFHREGKRLGIPTI